MVTLTATPARTLDQRHEALLLANTVRSKRADLKRDVKAGRVSVADVLADPPAHVATMRAFDLLLATPKLGRVKVSRALSRCGVSPSKTVGGMTDRQRRELVAVLRERQR